MNHHGNQELAESVLKEFDRVQGGKQDFDASRSPRCVLVAKTLTRVVWPNDVCYFLVQLILSIVQLSVR